jgi:transposase
VSKPCRYEPDINPTYQDLADHYQTAVIPARPGKPRDKAKVENAVLVAERWLLAPLRNHTFFSLAQLNQALAKQREQINNRPFKKLPSTRKELFDTIDKPAMKPLPAHPFEYSEWKKARVNIDYHVEVDRHYYSVPYQFAREQVDIRLTSTTVEVLFKGRRIASHKRSYSPGNFVTLHAHMPKSHQRHLKWTPSRIIRWAGKNGPNTEKLVTRILENKPHPEQGFRSALGIMRLEDRYAPQRVENACRRALCIGACSYKSVKSILKNGLDKQPLLFEKPLQTQPATHHNIRGRQYYRGEKEAEHAS